MATITLKEVNGGALSDLASGDSLVFSSSDSHEDNTDNVSLTRPNGGVVRSYEKWIKVVIDDLADNDLLSNFQLYMADGAAPAAGVTMQVRLTAELGDAVKTDSATAGTDLFSYTSANPLLLTAANVTYGLAGDDPGVAVVDGNQIGQYIVVQMDLTPQADLGVFSTNYGEIPITIRYDVA